MRWTVGSFQTSRRPTIALLCHGEGIVLLRSRIAASWISYIPLDAQCASVLGLGISKVEEDEEKGTLHVQLWKWSVHAKMPHALTFIFTPFSVNLRHF